MAVSKVIKRVSKKNPKTAKQSMVVNPYKDTMPGKMAKNKFQQRPMRKTVTRGKQNLQKSERADKPLRKARTRYGGR